MSENNENRRRRRVLGGIGGSILSIPAVRTATRADEENHHINPTYVPKYEEETAQFIRETFEESDRIRRQAATARAARARIHTTRRRTLRRLEDDQINALEAALTDTR